MIFLYGILGWIVGNLLILGLAVLYNFIKTKYISYKIKRERSKFFK